MTSDLENLFSSSHSHAEYLCQASLKSSAEYRAIASSEIDVNGQRPDDPLHDAVRLLIIKLAEV